MEDPTTILSSDPQDFEAKKLAACTTLANFIVKLYTNSLKSQMFAEVMRRSQFCYLLSILDCFERLQAYCNLSQSRGKGVTVKTQAIKIIVKQSKESPNEAPKLLNSTVSQMIKGAVRVRRLLNLAGNDFGIIDAFPDLSVNLFTGTRLNTTNFERWLKIVENGHLISEVEGRRLYDEHKDEDRVARTKKLKGKSKLIEA